MEKWFFSRTNGVIVLTAVLGAWQALEPFLSVEFYVVVNSILGALAVYYRSHPKVQ